MGGQRRDASSLSGAVAVVTGGCGFIGSHLVRRLLAIGMRRVTVIDSLRYGNPTNLGDDLHKAAVEVVRLTLGTDSATTLERCLQGADYLFHLAAEKHKQSEGDPDEVLRANVTGTRALFELAAKSGVKKTVFTSSLYAYGRMGQPPCRETDLPLPTTIYGISKLCGERLLAHYSAKSTMKGDVLRLFFVYGPRQFAGTGYKSVILKNFERLRAGEPPVILGDGKQVLDYVFVEDVVDAIVRCAESPSSGETLNVGSSVPTSIRQLTAAMTEVAGSRLVPVYAPPDWTAGSFRVAHTEKIESALGWFARTSLHEGLGRTWEWVKGGGVV